ESELWPSWRCSMDSPPGASRQIRRRAILHQSTWGTAGAACYNTCMLGSTRGLLERSAHLQSALKAHPASFPVKRQPSLGPLLACWTKKFTDDTPAKGAFIRTVREQISQVPDLLNPITDLAVIERHRALVDVLMAGIFPPAFFEQEFTAVLVPFL